MESSTYEHRYTALAVSQGDAKHLFWNEFENFVLDGFLAVGSFAPSNVKAEFYDFKLSKWIVVDDYPFANGTDISHYDMTYVPELSAFIVIGGILDLENAYATSTIISKFHDGVWKLAGKLNAARWFSCSC